MPYDEELIRLQKELAGREELEAKLRELQDQRREYDRNVISLHVAYRQEQAEVEKLEGRSLANYFLKVVGRLDDKLNQERQEAYAAKVKLDGAERELAAIDEDIHELQARMIRLRTAHAQYRETLDQKRAAVRASGTPKGERILELEERIGTLEAQKKEIREAMNAGYSARGTADRILSSLESADGWNTWDILGGGGIITHVAKHSHLDDAQDLIQELQGKLRRFKTELADIRIHVDPQVNVDGFLRFADYFFDGLFADWAVGSKISQAQNSVWSTRSQISQTLDRLAAMEAAADRELASLKSQLDELTVNA